MPCDCRQGTTATGQRALTLFAVCCGVGTPRICSEPPVNTTTRVCWSRQRCRQCQLWSLFVFSVVHVVIIPASGPQNNVPLLPKVLDEKLAKMHFSALGAELIVLSGDVGPTGTSPKADCGASCEHFSGDTKTGAFHSGSTGNHGGPTGPVHRQNRRCDSARQHLVRSIRTVYIQTAQKTMEVDVATGFNDPEERPRSTKCGSLTELLRYQL